MGRSVHQSDADRLSLRVDHDLAEHGVEQSRAAAGHAGGLDVDVAPDERPGALDVERRAEDGVVEPRDVAADGPSRRCLTVRGGVGGGGGRLRGERQRRRSLLSPAPTRPRAALRVVDEDRDAFQIHHRVVIAKNYIHTQTDTIIDDLHWKTDGQAASLI